MATSAGTVLSSVLERIRDERATMMATNTPATTANGQVLVYRLISYCQQLVNLAEMQIVNQVALQLNDNQVLYSTLTMASDFCAKVLAVTLGTSTTTTTTTTTPVTPTLVQSQASNGGNDTTSLTVTLPLTPTPGNLLLIMAYIDCQVGSWTPPAGFTHATYASGAGDTGLNGVQCTLYYRVVQSGDGTSYTISAVPSGGGPLGMCAHMEEWTAPNAPSGATIAVAIDVADIGVYQVPPGAPSFQTGDTASPPQIITTAANEAVISFIGCTGLSSPLVAPGAQTQLFSFQGYGFLREMNTAAGYYTQGVAGDSSQQNFFVSSTVGNSFGLSIALTGSYTVTVTTTTFTVTDEIDGPVDYKAFGRATRSWFTATGTELLSWGPIGQTLLALVPAFASSPPSVVVRYVQLVPAVAVATDPITVYDDTVEHVARLTALVCRLKTRQLTGFADELKSLMADMQVEETAQDAIGGKAD